MLFLWYAVLGFILAVPISGEASSKTAYAIRIEQTGISRQQVISCAEQELCSRDVTLQGRRQGVTVDLRVDVAMAYGTAYIKFKAADGYLYTSAGQPYVAIPFAPHYPSSQKVELLKPPPGMGGGGMVPLVLRTAEPMAAMTIAITSNE